MAENSPPITRLLWKVLMRQVPPARRREAMALAVVLDRCIRAEARLPQASPPPQVH